MTNIFMKPRRLMFDIETNGLLRKVTRMHLLIARDLDTHERFRFLEGDFGWKDLLASATLVIGHNIIDYDLNVLTKLFQFVLPKTVRIHDSLLMSQILDYRRFGMEGHSLEVWGNALGFPKLAFNDFEEYSPEMEVYCDRDLDLNERVYEILCYDFEVEIERNPFLGKFIKYEHKAAQWQARAQLRGWPVDRPLMVSLFKTITDSLKKVEDALLPILGHKFVYPDRVKGVTETKVAKTTKAGNYWNNIAEWFDIDPVSARYDSEDVPIVGAFTRVVAQPLKLSYSEDVKLFLFRQGWEPTEWNMKKDPLTNRMVQTSPKISEDSLEFLGGDGALYREYTKASARYGILKGWLENITDDDMLHGDSMLVGTPSMRTRHSVIANIPSSEALYGKEFRSIFKGLPGWTLVGCDSSGNQARGLAHYLDDEGFTNTLLNGDIHQYNADILTGIVQSMPGGVADYIVPRSAAKRILYAFLFGASGAKLWGYIFGKGDKERGNTLKAEFVKAVPGFQKLLKRLDGFFSATKKSNNGYGWIPSIAGNRIYVDSFHKLLVYLLQSCEKATCSAALGLTMEWLEEREIPYEPLIYYHDEIDFMVPDEYAAEAARLGKLAFKEAPKEYGITIMDGDAKIGKNWLEIH